MKHSVLLGLFVALLVLPTTASGQEERSLESFYERVAEDLADEPERNLNWGVYYGHATMLKRARKDKHIAKNFTFHDWRPVYQLSQQTDPLRTLVFAQTVKPNARWRAVGVDKPFTAYLVMVAHADQQGAALAATRTFRQGKGEQITLDDGTELDVGAAQATGYFGHNFFYDYEGFEWDGLSKVSGAPDRQVGIFAVGCNTARVPGFDDWIGPHTTVLLYSRSLMASEGYSTLALADGLLQRLNGRELVDHGDRTYQYFQKLGKPDRRVGKPFVSQSYRLSD